jgi:hypothetical protein
MAGARVEMYVGNHGRFQHNRQEHGTRQLPSVATRWLLALFPSGLRSSVGAPPTADPLIRGGALLGLMAPVSWAWRQKGPQCLLQALSG